MNIKIKDCYSIIYIHRVFDDFEPVQQWTQQPSFWMPSNLNSIESDYVCLQLELNFCCYAKILTILQHVPQVCWKWQVFAIVVCQILNWTSPV